MKKAFSLLELSFVIVIVSIVIAGLLANSVGTSQNDKVRITNERISKIYQALGRYLLVNQALPCPASLKMIKASDANYGLAVACSAALISDVGIYQSSTVGELYYGAVPTQNLGLSNEFAEDGWGTKFSYAVNNKFTSATTSDATVGFGGVNTANLIATQGATTSSSNVFIVISHGANKAGGFDANSNSKIASSSNVDESSNDVDTLNSPSGGKATFDATFSVDATSDGFDDIVIFKTRDNLVADFQLQWLIPCQTTSLGGFSWPAGKCGEIVNSTTICPPAQRNSVYYPTKRCGAGGVWSANILNPCT